MIAASLVQRVPCPTDRRVLFAALTPQGRELLAQALVVHTADLREAFAGFGRRDLDALDGLLDRLRDAPPPAR
jgi:MarR family 2-MHQ and catechol resistance regulon transcriptional repressor